MLNFKEKCEFTGTYFQGEVIKGSESETKISLAFGNKPPQHFSVLHLKQIDEAITELENIKAQMLRYENAVKPQ
jgi:hypothetical protein